MKTIALIVIVLLVAGVLWYAFSPLFMNTVADDPVPTRAKSTMDSSAVAPRAEEKPANTHAAPVSIVPTAAHPASGTVRVVTDGNDRYLRYENYKTINGPDLRVYLATDIQATNFVDLGVLKATEGNVNYPIPADTDLTKYRYALIWCEDFAVLFNSAELSR